MAVDEIVVKAFVVAELVAEDKSVLLQEVVQIELVVAELMVGEVVTEEALVLDVETELVMMELLKVKGKAETE